MVRTLSLVLDDEGKKSLTLFTDEAAKIDKFTTKNFENSDQIREYYKEQIDRFLSDNNNYLEAIKKRTDKNFKGRIVILEMYDDDMTYHYRDRAVLYKKHIVAFKEMIKDRKTMLRFLEFSKLNFNYLGFKRLISPFLSREIKITDYSKKSRVELIGRELHKQISYYEILRLITKAYLEERKERPNLKTIEAIYNDYLKTKTAVKKQEHKERIIPKISDDGYITIDNIRYSIDELPFDLEQLNKVEDINFWFDGLGEVDEEKHNFFH